VHFDLNEEHQQIHAAVERVIRDHVDLTELTRGQGGSDDIRQKLQPVLSDMGLSSLLAPEDAGGMGLGLLGLCALSDLFGENAVPTSTIQQALGAWLVAEHGDEQQKNRWLSALLADQVQVSFAICSASGSWLPEDWNESAADSSIQKLHVESPEAGLFVVATKDGLVLIPGEEVAEQGERREALDVTRPLGQLEFKTTDASPIGDFGVAQRVYDALLILTAADAAGAGRRALHLAVEYLETRKQFGRALGSFQGLKHQLANMAVDIEPAIFLCWYAAHLWDLEAHEASRIAALAKAHATDVAVKTARASVEAHGGIGYTWEYPLHLLLKRAMFDRMVYASPQRLRERVARISEDEAA